MRSIPLLTPLIIVLKYYLRAIELKYIKNKNKKFKNKIFLHSVFSLDYKLGLSIQCKKIK
jgi:hypothetical protein